MTISDEIETSVAVYNCIFDYGVAKELAKLGKELNVQLVPRVVSVCKGKQLAIQNDENSNCLVMIITRNAYPKTRKIVQAMLLLDRKQNTDFLGFRMNFDVNETGNELIAVPKGWIGLYGEERPVMEWI